MRDAPEPHTGNGNGNLMLGCARAGLCVRDHSFDLPLDSSEPTLEECVCRPRSPLCPPSIPAFLHVCSADRRERRSGRVAG